MSSRTDAPAGLFDLPAEVRAEIWRYCVATRANRHPHQDGLAKYTLSLALLQTCRQIYAEARAELHRSNLFIKFTSPWENTRDYVESNGRVPVLVSGPLAKNFPVIHLDCRIDSPATSTPDATAFIIICGDDLPAFGRLWWYTQLTHGHVNQYMRLRLTLSHLPSVTREVQTRLLDPFINVKNLQAIEVKGNVDPTIRDTFLRKLNEPYESPESCIERALALKDDGNRFLAEKRPQEAIEKFEDSFRAMLIIINGRQRDEWGESHFEDKLTSGPYRDQSGNYARLVIRIELVAQTVMAYYLLKDHEMARFWGMRSIHMARVQFGDTVDMPLLDFDASGNWARVYFGTSLASREMGQAMEAFDLYRIARLKLPGDAKIAAEAPAFERAKTEYMTGIQRSASA